MNAEEIVKALRCVGKMHPGMTATSECDCPYFRDTEKTGLAYRCDDMQPCLDAADLIESLQAQLAEYNCDTKIGCKLIESVKTQLAERDREIERLREAQRWIPVDEKSDDLPHDDGGQREVMCYFADGVMESFNIYRIRAWNERRRKIGANDLITHFMPLPAAPEEGE